jgi:8-amino-7-oxononanoate synthase
MHWKINDFMLKLSQKLEQRREAVNLRSLTIPKGLIDFCSNDYLGLASNYDLNHLIEKEYKTISTNKPKGATGSRLISGNSQYYEDLEKYLADLFKSETTLLFNSGYAANMGVLSSIPQKGDTILYDELSHACIKDGARLSFADRFSFKHNDMADLEKRMQKAAGDIFVVVEAIYSMDGDAAPLKELVMLCYKYSAYLIVDEAHSTGIFGENGSGLVCQLGLQEKVFIRIHTFGKAIGTHGACVAASQIVRDFLINFSRQFIYTTALPLHNLVSIKCAFEYLTKHADLPSDLQQKIDLFKSKTINYQLSTINSNSAIQAILIPRNAKVKALAQKIQTAGFDVRPILSPTVKIGEERLRICLHTTNSKEELEGLSGLLKQI